MGIMAALRMLAIAAATGRVGCVFLIDGRLKDWRMSSKAAASPENAEAVARTWIETLGPDVIVTEKVEEAAKKGEKTKRIIVAIAAVAAENHLLDVAIKRAHEHPSKYEEAAELAQRHPEIAAWLPAKRRFFENEPRNTVLFEALSLAETVMRGGSASLAAALG